MKLGVYINVVGTSAHLHHTPPPPQEGAWRDMGDKERRESKREREAEREGKGEGILFWNVNKSSLGKGGKGVSTTLQCKHMGPGR